MSNAAKRHKKPSFKDEAIDVTELAGMSNMRGMLSFLDTKPEDYARLFASQNKQDATPVDSTSSRLIPSSNLLPGSDLSPGSTLLSGGRLQPDSNLLSGGDLLLPLDQGSSPPRIPPARPAVAESAPPPNATGYAGEITDLTLEEPLSRSLPGRNLLPGSDLLTLNGRVVKIRVARSVQDGHTSGEHLLITAMWKKGKPESGDTRLLKSGLAELSRWTGAHKTSCRAYLRSLIAKLAIEEVQTFDAAAGKDGARTYRIFSFDKILERRRQANMTHVIRTGAVSFIDPKTGLKLEPCGRLLPDSNLQPDGILLSESKQRAGSKERPVSGSNHPSRPGSNHPSPSINNFTQEKAVRTSSSDSFIRQALAQYADVDDDAFNRLKFGIRRIRPDATDAEIVYFIHTKGELILKRGSAIDNPIGFLVTSVPKCFEGESFKRFRDEQGREAPTEPDNKSDYVDREYWKELAAHPDATEEMRRLARQQLGAASGDEY